MRRTFLCGTDHFSDQNYEHRRQWIIDKLQSLSAIFSIDICAYAVMSNHYHVVLRVDTDAENAWSEQEGYCGHPSKMVLRNTRKMVKMVLRTRWYCGMVLRDTHKFFA